MRRTMLNIAAALVCGGAGGAAQAEVLALTHAHITSLGPAGDLNDATVLIENGKIKAVGRGLALPAGARVTDAAGSWITPGLVASNTPLATSEIGEGVMETNDNGTASTLLSAALDMKDAVNPESTLIPIVRLGGVTDAVVTPTLRRRRDHQGMVFAGKAVAIHLADGDADIVEKRDLGMVLVMGEDGARAMGGSRAAEMAQLRADFDDVRAFAAHRPDYDLGRFRPLRLSRPDLEALVPVVEGRMPLMVSVHRASDIRAVLAFARAQKVKIILEGAEEAWRVAPEIAAERVPVLLDAGADLPESFDRIGSTLENAARLHAAGVLIGIENPPIYQGGRTPRIDAGRAAAHGLPVSAALASITLNPAKIWGLADRIGSIEPGKDANLVLWSGDPLEPLSAPTAVYIHGVSQPMRSRDLDLRDRYLKRDDLPPAYH